VTNEINGTILRVDTVKVRPVKKNLIVSHSGYSALGRTSIKTAENTRKQ
jgi:hypothetical protein